MSKKNFFLFAFLSAVYIMCSWLTQISHRFSFTTMKGGHEFWCCRQHDLTDANDTSLEFYSTTDLSGVTQVRKRLYTATLR